MVGIESKIFLKDHYQSASYLFQYVENQPCRESLISIIDESFYKTLIFTCKGIHHWLVNEKIFVSRLEKKEITKEGDLAVYYEQSDIYSRFVGISLTISMIGINFRILKEIYQKTTCLKEIYVKHEIEVDPCEAQPAFDFLFDNKKTIFRGLVFHFSTLFDRIESDEAYKVFERIDSLLIGHAFFEAQRYIKVREYAKNLFHFKVSPLELLTPEQIKILFQYFGKQLISLDLSGCAYNNDVLVLLKEIINQGDAPEFRYLKIKDLLISPPEIAYFISTLENSDIVVYQDFQYISEDINYDPFIHGDRLLERPASFEDD